MTIYVLDHVFFILLALIFPVMSFFEMRKSASQINAGRTELRMKLYHKIIREEWAATLIVVAAWFLLGRTAAGLGLIPQGGGVAWVGYGLTALVCALLIVQARVLPRSAERLAGVREQLDWLSFLVPSSKDERRAFTFTSVTAGVCEEVIFRGYLTAYFASFFGMPLWGGAVLSSIAFGVAHMYQGPKGILRTGAFGGLMAWLYLLTGSIWGPILVHAVMDLSSGHIAYRALSKPISPGDASHELAV